MLALLGSVVTGTFVSYYDKLGLSTGMSKTKYLFLKSLCILPFIPLLLFFYPIYFKVNVFTFLLLFAIIAVMILSTIGFAGVAKQTSPYESMMYATLSMPLVYVIDVLIGSEQFSYLAVFYLALIIIGVLLLTNFKLSQINFKSSLILGLLSSSAKGYLLFFFLKLVSTPVYLFLVYFITTIILLLFFKNKIEPITKKDYKWAFLTQSVGLVGLTLNTMLLNQSVTFYTLRIPLILVGLMLTSFLVKNTKVSIPPTLKNIAAVTICILGICLYSFGSF